jgi:hypothetical protein
MRSHCQEVASALWPVLPHINLELSNNVHFFLFSSDFLPHFIEKQRQKFHAPVHLK